MSCARFERSFTPFCLACANFSGSFNPESKGPGDGTPLVGIPPPGVLAFVKEARFPSAAPGLPTTPLPCLDD